MTEQASFEERGMTAAAAVAFLVLAVLCVVRVGIDTHAGMWTFETWLAAALTAAFTVGSANAAWRWCYRA